MMFEKATKDDLSKLTALRIAYLQEDFGGISQENLDLLQAALPSYYEKHLNRDLFVYVAKDSGEIVSCVFLLMVEKPMSPAFITGKTGTVLNVYTRPEYRQKGHAKQLMKVMLEDAKAKNISVLELKATEDGYGLYKSVGFEDVADKYHNMKIKIV